MTDTPRSIGPQLTGAAKWQHLGRRATAMEAAGWRAIGRTLARRPAVGPGESGHSWDKPVRPAIVTFLVISALEVVIVDIITMRWPWVRFPLLVLGIWGVLFMIGMMLANRSRPHLVGPDGIRVRAGSDIEVWLPWTVVESVQRRRRPLAGAPALSLTGTPESQTLNLVVQDGTHLDIDLVEPTTVRLPPGQVTVSTVAVAVDDPTAFLEAVRVQVGAR